MSQKVIIDSSIAAIVNIDNVGKNEIVPIYLTSPIAWTDTYNFKLFDAPQKNSEINLNDTPLSVDDNVMTIIIDAMSLLINEGLYYYEISSLEDKRVIFKGSLNIIK